MTSMQKNSKSLSSVMLRILSPLVMVVTSKNRNHAGKRCRILRPTKFQPSLYEADFYIFVVVNVVVKPSCVRPRRQKHHDKVSRARSQVSAPNPLADVPPIRWIAPAPAIPGLIETVLLGRIIRSAFGVFRQSTNVQVKMEFGIQLIKQILRSFPQVCFAGKHYVRVRFCSPPSAAKPVVSALGQRHFNCTSCK